MNQTYRIVGWMTESNHALSRIQWQDITSRLNPKLDYVPFKVVLQSGVIFGLMDQLLPELYTSDFENFQQELQSIRSNRANRLMLNEYTLLGEKAYIGCDLMNHPSYDHLTSVQTFKEFADVCGWRLSFKTVNGCTYACILNRSNQELMMQNYCYTVEALLLTQIEQVLKEIALDLVAYSKACFEERIDRTRGDFLNSIQSYRSFASKEELETLIRLLENEKSKKDLVEN